MKVKTVFHIFITIWFACYNKISANRKEFLDISNPCYSCITKANLTLHDIDDYHWCDTFMSNLIDILCLIIEREMLWVKNVYTELHETVCLYITCKLILYLKFFFSKHVYNFHKVIFNNLYQRECLAWPLFFWRLLRPYIGLRVGAYRHLQVTLSFARRVLLFHLQCFRS